jgi:ferric-dicitrate binding protein FerR (iron transport regulator)
MDEADREEMARPRLRLIRSHAVRWAAVAAVIVLCFGIAYFFRPLTVIAPRGEFAQVQLPDGSLVQLNSESSVKYHAHFLNTRSVRLEGEAYFEVTDSDKQFVVETFNANTAVLGTQFNVRARSHEPDAATSVVVAVGKVHLRSKLGDDEGVVLTAGQQSHLHSRARRPSAPESVALARRLAWRTGGLAFSDQPFAVIFDEIERRYDVEIEASEEILAQAFSYYVHDPKSAESVIADLVAAEGLRYRETSQGFEVFRP